MAREPWLTTVWFICVAGLTVLNVVADSPTFLLWVLGIATASYGWGTYHEWKYLLEHGHPTTPDANRFDRWLYGFTIVIAGAWALLSLLSFQLLSFGMASLLLLLAVTRYVHTVDWLRVRAAAPRPICGICAQLPDTKRRLGLRNY